ncbi:MAG: hypothetical protein ACXQTP_04130 [Candidatus Methanofastidiosia archaeon]
MNSKNTDEDREMPLWIRSMMDKYEIWSGATDSRMSYKKMVFDENTPLWIRRMLEREESLEFFNED